MRRLVKWVGRGLAGLVVLVLLLALAGYAYLRNGVQPMSGNMDIAGLSAPVDIVRDANAVVHISAQSKADAYAALGFAHAQDRLWQMEVLRMSGQGRLSEMFGEPTVEIDRFLRALGFMQQAESSYAALSSKHKAEIDAYAAGVNAFLTRETGVFEPKLPPEYLILGHQPEPWQPAHSLLVLKMMSLQLSMNRSREMRRLKLAAQGFSPAEIADIVPVHRDDDPPPLPDLRAMYDLKSWTGEKEEETASITDLFEGAFSQEHFASNNWVFAGSRTESGKPILANDPHLGFTAPSLWYLAHLSWQDKSGRQRNVIGATIPAFPTVLLGRTDSVAWGFTNAGADVQDIFIEQVDPDNPARYRTPDGWREFETREERIIVRGGDDVLETMRRTRHGPVLPESYADLWEILPDNHVAALAWTGLSDRDPSFAMASSLADAETVADFRESVSQSIAPMQAIVVADADGNIALMTPAAVPVRNPQNQISGRAPVPGWDARYDWWSTVNGNQLIDIENPLSGALGTANSRLPVESQSSFYTYDWDEPYRTDRVQNTIVDSNTPHTVQASIAGQLDSFSPPLVDLRDRMANLESVNLPETLRDWDGRMSAENAAPHILTAFHRNLLSIVFKDELGNNLEATYAASGIVVLRALDGASARNWCDDVSTPAEESCDQAMRSAWEITRTELGDNPPNWGEVHTVLNEHRPFSSVWPLSKLFTIERPTSGGNFALLRAESDFANDDHPYRAVHGAGYRAVYDFTDLDASIFVQTTGQSGNPFSRHYDDMADLWAQGRYLPMSTKPADYEAGALGRWTLTPAQ
ncbi:MAG: penicillin acylase family protein [Ahrensia sp.]|nr:penicillin acylase family protein [Ahrensia sp.]